MKDKPTARICVPVCVKQASELALGIARASSLADLIELRLDCLNEAEFQETALDLKSLCRHSTRPLIFTLRPAEEGGRRKLSRDTRFDFWLSEIRSLLKAGEHYADIEFDVAHHLMKAGGASGVPDWSRVICSFHDFERVPVELETIYERMAATPARILKIAVQAVEITDCIAVLRLLERARREGREMIAVAMGEAGLLTRILAPSRGAFLTYGSLDDEQATAPGQISAEQLRQLYRIHALDEQTEITGLIGYPVAHSISPHMHNAAFAARQMNAVYIPFVVRQLEDFLRRMVNPRTRELDWKLCGLSVTAPHKSAVMCHLDWIEAAAQEIGAVNTIVIEDERLLGYNTDAAAALAPFQSEQIDLKGASVAIIGAGGATRALLWSLREAGARVTVFARDTERAEVLARSFGASCVGLDGANFGAFQVVVNATPLGTRGLSEAQTPALAYQLRGVEIAYDLVYNPRETRFMREAHEAGCKAFGGLDMLIAQAAAQFKLWTGAEAPLSAMREAAEKAVLSDE